MISNRPKTLAKKRRRSPAFAAVPGSAPSWRSHDIMWVIGCIDANGAITANPSREGRTHRPEESKGKRWRWCVWSQEFCDVFMGGQAFTDDEIFAVWEWLRKRDYTDDRTMPNDQHQATASTKL